MEYIIKSLANKLKIKMGEFAGSKKDSAPNLFGGFSTDPALKSFIEDVREYAIYYLTPEGNILSWNKGAENIKGYKRDEILGEHFSRFYKEADIKAGKPEYDLKNSLNNGEYYTEDWRVRKDGKLFWASNHFTTLLSNDGNLLGFTKITRDLTNRRIAEEKLRQQALQLSNAQRLAHIGSWEWDLETNKVTWSDELYRIYGLIPQEKEITYDLFLEMIHPSERKYIQEKIRNAIKNKAEIKYTDKITRPDGSVRILSTQGEIVTDQDGNPKSVFGSCQDVTEAKRNEEELLKSRQYFESLVQERTSELTRINISLLNEISERQKTEDQIAASLKEKELLLKEVHHRVKNNLQVISSLLSLQSGFVRDKEALEVFTESRNRVRSMAMIHEKIYKSENLHRINFSEYLTDLIDSLIITYRDTRDVVKKVINAEELYVDIDRSISLGLIINELISNALKYGLKTDYEPVLYVNLFKHGDDVTILIKDNGPGFPEGFRIEESESLGLLLIKTLTEQLQGTIELSNNNGAVCTLKFSLKDKVEF